jgi:hypothetical protein
MAISYKDFCPVVLKQGNFFEPTVLEELSEVITKANRWIGEFDINIINVETLLAPYVGEACRLPTGTLLRGDDPVGYYQVVRVWYEIANPFGES